MKTSQNRFDQFWLFSVDFENFIIPVYQICLQYSDELIESLLPYSSNLPKCLILEEKSS